MLRRPASTDPIEHDALDGDSVLPLGRNGRVTTLRWRITMLTASLVAIVVGIMTIVSYWTVTSALQRDVDRDLDAKATTMLARTLDPQAMGNLQQVIENFREYNKTTRISVSAPGWSYAIGDDLPLVHGSDSSKPYAAETIEDERILVKSNDLGATVILARDMGATYNLINGIGVVLTFVGLVGIAAAFVTGALVARTSLRPIARLQSAVRHVAKTDELRPIPVVGTDELAQLTHSFNEMLEALQTSRTRQTQLVADAGHELKTPLTSMRTNIELLMLMHKSPHANIPPEEQEALEADVIAQMEELSTLIGDLVDLAREQNPEKTLEQVSLLDVVDTALERVQRRRPDVKFQMRTQSWYLDGDSFALGRAVLNLLDNAAKWSPVGGVVRLDMEYLPDGQLALSVSDSGPGIPVADREKVFERFYRSVEARSMPGSGLGLAIVQQTIQRHGGDVTVHDSDDGGTKMLVTLPGVADDTHLPALRAQKED